MGSVLTISRLASRSRSPNIADVGAALSHSSSQRTRASLGKLFSHHRAYAPFDSNLRVRIYVDVVELLASRQGGARHHEEEHVESMKSHVGASWSE